MIQMRHDGHTQRIRRFNRDIQGCDANTTRRDQTDPHFNANDDIPMLSANADDFHWIEQADIAGIADHNSRAERKNTGKTGVDISQHARL